MGELRSAVDALVACDPSELDDDALGELIVEVTRQRDRLEAVVARATAAHGRRLAWKADGARSQKQWLSERCRLSRGQAAAASDVARRLTQLPQTTDALADGSIGAEHARIAARAVRDLPDDAVGGLDRLVAEEAATANPSTLRRAIDDYAHRATPDSLAEREDRAWRTRRLDVRRGSDGSVIVDGRLDPVGGETVLSALAPLAAPHDTHDDRLPEQRRADALVELAGRALSAGDQPTVARQRPHVTVTVDLDTLKHRPGSPSASLDRLGAISGEAARRLACDAGVTRVITRGASQPIDVGRASRTVTVSQWRTLVVRDRGCVGCAAPAAWCEAHHIRHWADGGPTNLDNLALVCWGCHRSVHEGRYKLVRGPTGNWAIHPPPPKKKPRRPSAEPGRPRGAVNGPARPWAAPVQQAARRTPMP
jgi:hypothetical protein